MYNHLLCKRVMSEDYGFTSGNILFLETMRLNLQDQTWDDENVMNSYYNFVFQLMVFFVESNNYRKFYHICNNFPMANILSKTTRKYGTNLNLFQLSIMIPEDRWDFFIHIYNELKAHNLVHLFSENDIVHGNPFMMSCITKKFQEANLLLNSPHFDVHVDLNMETYTHKNICFYNFNVFNCCLLLSNTKLFLTIIEKYNKINPYLMCEIIDKNVYQSKMRKLNLFYFCCSNYADNVDVLDVLMKNFPSFKGYNPLLFFCIENGSINCFKYLVDNNEHKINIQNTKGNTLLAKCLFRDREEMALYLLQKENINVNLVNKESRAPISYFNFDRDVNQTNDCILNLLIEKTDGEILNNHMEAKNMLEKIINFYHRDNDFLPPVVRYLDDHVLYTVKKFVKKFPESVNFSLVNEVSLILKNYSPIVQCIRYHFPNVLSFLLGKLNDYLPYYVFKNFIERKINNIYYLSPEIIDLLLTKGINREMISNFDEREILNSFFNNPALIKKFLSHNFSNSFYSICNNCGRTHMDHLNYLDRGEILMQKVICALEDHFLVRCIKNGFFNNFIYYINRHNCFYDENENWVKTPINYFELKSLKQIPEEYLCKRSIDIINHYTSPWSKESHYLYSKEQKEIVKLLLLIQNRSDSLFHNYYFLVKDYIIPNFMVFKSLQ